MGKKEKLTDGEKVVVVLRLLRMEESGLLHRRKKNRDVERRFHIVTCTEKSYWRYFGDCLVSSRGGERDIDT